MFVSFATWQSAHSLYRSTHVGWSMMPWFERLSVACWATTLLGQCLCYAHGIGERYCCVDYTVLSSVAGTTIHHIVLTYDIRCQWCKNWSLHMKEFPPNMQLSEQTKIEVSILSWHINGHGAPCQSNFSLEYMQGVGRTCGEKVETSWTQMNMLGTSTQGSRSAS